MLRLELGPLEPEESLALAEAVTEAAPLPPHIVKLAAERSGGSPQFLRDLLRAAAAGSTDLPDSVESAALARLDRLPPHDRALIRRASVLGLSFHPRQLEALLDGDVPVPDEDTWGRLDAYFKTRRTATCASAARWCATSPTPACRSAFGASCTRRPPASSSASSARMPTRPRRGSPCTSPCRRAC